MIEFVKKLSNIKYPNQNQKNKELWDVEGILHNQKFKFDLRPLSNNAKQGSFKTKADKIVYDINGQYIIVDVEELHKHLKDNSLKVVQLEDLIFKLDWNIILSK
jgi:hypothetical protein